MGRVGLLGLMWAYDTVVDWNGEVYNLYMVGAERSIVVKPYMSNLETAFNDELKPYLRPMSSMSEREQREYGELRSEVVAHNADDVAMSEVVEWLRKHHLDFEGLIGMGEALEAPEGMYK